MKRGTKVVSLLSVGVLVFLGIHAYRSAREQPDHVPYPTGTTSFSYSGFHSPDGKSLAVFKFGNAKGIRLKLEGTIKTWDEAAQMWKERRWDLKTLPNRRLKEIEVGEDGKWKLMVRAYANPTAREKLVSRFTKEPVGGGLIGAWSSPDMLGSKPSTNGAAAVSGEQ